MIKIEIGSILLGHTSFLFVESLCIYYFTYVETEPKAARGGTISCLDPWVKESYGWCSSCSCCLYRLHRGWYNWVPVGWKRLLLLHGNEHSDPGQIQILFNRPIYLLVEWDVMLSFHWLLVTTGWASRDRNDILCWLDWGTNSRSYGRKTSVQTGMAKRNIVSESLFENGLSTFGLWLSTGRYCT